MGESTFADGAQNDPASDLADLEDVVAALWMDSVASILEELASTDGAPVRAAEGASLCPEAQCGSTFDAIGSTALAGILICVLAVVGTLAIRRNGRRRSRTERAAEGG